MMWGYFIAGAVFGGLTTFTLCVRWAWNAIKPLKDFVDQHGGWDNCERTLVEMARDADAYRLLKRARLAK